MYLAFGREDAMARGFTEAVKSAQVGSRSKRGGNSRKGAKNEQEGCVKPERGSWIFNAAKSDLISVLDNLPVGVAVLGSPIGNALYINNQIVDTLGYTLTETPSTRSLMKKAIPDRKARSEAYKGWRQSVRSGSGEPAARPYICGDGTVRSFEHRTVALRKDLIVNLWIDVTRREKAEAQLRESESRFRSFFENSSDPFVLFDGERVVSCNRAAQKMFGYEDRKRIIGATMEKLSPEKQPDGILSALRARSLFKAALKRGSNRFEWVVQRADGKETPVEASITTITLGGKTLLFAVLRDITTWKEARRALLYAKADLENRVRERTSDLATANKRLLREIKARKRTEQETRKSREELRYLSEHLQRIREEERARIAREVHDQLGQALSAVTIDLACLRERLPGQDAGLKEEVREIEKRIGDTTESVREICRELRPPILDDFGLPTAIKWHLGELRKKTGMDCTASIDEEIPVHQKEISLVIFRIYQEAMINVLRHARATRVHVMLKLNKNHLVLVVKDNGKGISAEQITSPLSLGILGIRERVRFWGGKSLFTGSPDKGTTVRVSIPLRRRGSLSKSRFRAPL
jgi:PAS domain S-box-containing protein